MLENGFYAVPQGKLATVVTHLEMRARPAPRALPQVEAELERMARPDLDWYRGLFRLIGEDYLWFSRLTMADEALASILHDEQVHVYRMRRGGEDAGLLELDFRQNGECELAFFGLAPEHVGGGAGRWLMEQALDLAWAAPIHRFHVHTCTLDSPQALPFYIRSGFVPYKREVEVADDPRLTGLSPKAAAPQVPIL